MIRNEHSPLFKATIGKICTPLTRVLTPVFLRLGITPNLITLSNLGWGILVLYFLINDNLAGASVTTLVIAVVDGIDGDYARRTGRVSLTGAMLDSYVDFIVFAFTFAGLCSITIVSLFPFIMNFVSYIYYTIRTVEYEDKGIIITVRQTFLRYFAGATAERMLLSGVLLLGINNRPLIPSYLIAYYSLVAFRIAVHHKRNGIINSIISKDNITAKNKYTNL